MSLRVFAPAKINLTLEVGRPRADGYHPLQSAVMFADVGDWIEAAPGDQLSLTISGPFATALEADGNNLVFRAARLIGDGRGASLKLEKHLPVASGIGGGSSDAAATLLALNELWGLENTQGQLARIGDELGADVPVCVCKHSAWITDAGGAVAAMSAPTLDAVLVNAGNPLSTAAVYRRFDELGLGGSFAPRSVPNWANAREAADAINLYGNDLLAPAISLMPELEDLLAALRADRRALCANLSGSGATCFVLCRDAGDASALTADLSARNPAWWVQATKLGGAP